jgi:hypothetical protein
VIAERTCSPRRGRGHGSSVAMVASALWWMGGHRSGGKMTSASPRTRRPTPRDWNPTTTAFRWCRRVMCGCGGGGAALWPSAVAVRPTSCLTPKRGPRCNSFTWGRKLGWGRRRGSPARRWLGALPKSDATAASELLTPTTKGEGKGEVRMVHQVASIRRRGGLTNGSRRR